jgi:hypothetical protein
MKDILRVPWTACIVGLILDFGIVLFYNPHLPILFYAYI